MEDNKVAALFFLVGGALVITAIGFLAGPAWAALATGITLAFLGGAGLTGE